MEKTGIGATGVEKEEIVRKGRLVLTKIKIDTDFDICSDEVKNSDDNQNFYILKDGFHWLKEQTEDDKKKLEYLGGIIPITLHSCQKIKFDVIFQVVFGNIDKATINVIQNGNEDSEKYLFIEQSKSNLSKDDEFKFTYESTNTPYQDTIQYFEKFELIFQITDDNKCYSKRVRFRLYVTWKKPLWDNYGTVKDITDGKIYQFGMSKETSLKVKNGEKKYILESLLFISCQSKINILSENQVIDRIFDNIKSLKVKRPRHSEVLGYWRCSSALNPSVFPPRDEIFNNNTRSVRFMLRVGDGRCGEWAEFFTDLCLTQGIEDVDMLTFYINYPNIKESSIEFISNIFLVKSWNIRDPRRPIDKGGKAQGNDKPLNFFSDHVFSVYKGVFYDTSYGLKGNVSHLTRQNILKEYCPIALDGIPFATKDSSGEYFFDDIHTQKFIDPRETAYRTYPNTLFLDKLKYKTIKENCEKYLE